MNLLVSINDNYIEHLKTMLYSLYITNKVEINIFLLNQNIQHKNIIKLESFIRRFKIGRLNEIKVSSEFLQGAKINSHFSIEMYFRIFVSELVPDYIDRILWLDSDIIVKGNILDFYNCDFEGKSIVVCPDRSSANNKKRLKLDSECIYFNSGVILFNLKKIRSFFDGRYVIDIIQKKKDVLVFPDQDILNFLYEKDAKYIDANLYNYQIDIERNLEEVKMEIDNIARILHYVGGHKPWKYTIVHYSHKYYWKYALCRGRVLSYFSYKIAAILYKIYKKSR